MRGIPCPTILANPLSKFCRRRKSDITLLGRMFISTRTRRGFRRTSCIYGWQEGGALCDFKFLLLMVKFLRDFVHTIRPHFPLEYASGLHPFCWLLPCSRSKPSSECPKGPKPGAGIVGSPSCSMASQLLRPEKAKPKPGEDIRQIHQAFGRISGPGPGCLQPGPCLGWRTGKGKQFLLFQVLLSHEHLRGRRTMNSIRTSP